MSNDAPHRLLLDNLNTATLLLDERLCLEYMNPAAEMLLAVSGQRSHGQFISELFTESPEALSPSMAEPSKTRQADVLTVLAVLFFLLAVVFAGAPLLNAPFEALGSSLLLIGLAGVACIGLFVLRGSPEAPQETEAGAEAFLSASVSVIGFRMV